MTVYADLIRLIQDGESVSAGVTNRPILDLAQRTQYLRELISALLAGQVLAQYGAPLQAGMLVGTPVYADTDGTYRPALSAAASGINSGAVNASSFVAGIVSDKQTDTSGTVILGGKMSLPLATWATVTQDGTSTAGRYYASAATAGKLTRNQTGLDSYVGTLDAQGGFLVQPKLPTYNSHNHLKFDLLGSPAGTVVDPSPSGTHSVNTPNTAMRGWLPANSTYFPGFSSGVQIPVGAVFGYNIQHASESALLNQFPPVPVETAQATQSGVVVTPYPMLINSYGIWWLDNSYGSAPWSVDYNLTGYATPITLWMTKATSASVQAQVTSLNVHPASTIPIQILDASGNPASTGSLLLKLSSLLSAGASNIVNGTAVKGISGSTFTTGPVVDLIKAGNNVMITATAGDATNGYRGTVTVHAASASVAVGRLVSSTLANCTLVEAGEMVPHVHIPIPGAGTATATWIIDVPENAPLSAVATPYMWIAPHQIGTVPNCTGFTYFYTVNVPGQVYNNSYVGSSSVNSFSIGAVNDKILKIPLLNGANPVVPPGSIITLTLSYTNPVGFDANALNIFRVFAQLV